MKGIEHFLPLYRTERHWKDGSRVILELPLFPGYIFVRVRSKDRVRVLEVPGALSLVTGTAGAPAPLREEEIKALRSGICLYRAEPHPLMQSGQRARIRHGVLAGMEGIVIRIKSRLRIVLTLDLIMKAIAVEIDVSDLEMLPA